MKLNNFHLQKNEKITINLKTKRTNNKNMKKQNMVILLILLSALPAYADIFKTGHHDIRVINKITNVKDFPNYTFFTVAKETRAICPIKVVSGDGVVPDNYKFCKISVYATRKTSFDINYMGTLSDKELEKYLQSERVKEVLTGLQLYVEVPNDDTRKEILQQHTISLDETTEAPQLNFYEPQYFFYFALLVVGLLIFFFITLKRMQKQKYT